MLPKSTRSTKKTIDTIFKEGRFIGGKALNFKYILTKSGPSTVSFIVPKFLLASAVKRNSLRRLGYRALPKFPQAFPPNIAGAFIFKEAHVSLSSVRAEIEKIIAKIR